MDFDRLKNGIIKELIQDKEFANFLCKQNLSDTEMIDLICAAPVSLYRKAKMLKKLSEYQKNDDKEFSYITYYNEVQMAISALSLKDDEIFIAVGYTREHGEKTQFETFPSRSIEKICKYIKNKYEFKKVTCDYWHKVEKWHKATDNEIAESIRDLGIDCDMADDYIFTFVYDEICYFRTKGENVKFDLFFSGMSLNLPTPFKVGDILEVSETPFAPKTEVLVLSTSDYDDCCSPSCLFFGKNGLEVGALKHSHIYKEYIHENVSPLYSVKRFKGKLTKKETVFAVVSEYIKNDKARGEEIYNYIMNSDKNKRTPQALIDYIDLITI